MAKSTKRSPTGVLEEAPEQTREAALQAIQTADAPVLVRKLPALLQLPKKTAGSRVLSLLTGDITDGRVFEWGKTALWYRKPEDVARERLTDMARHAVLPRAELKKRVANQKPAVSAMLANTVIGELMQTGRLREVPAPPPGKKKVLVDTKNPEAYLALQIVQICGAFGKEIPVSRVRDLLDLPASGEMAVAIHSEQVLSVPEIAEKLFAAMNRIAFAPGTTVTFYRLRQQPELRDIPKEQFDAAALRLQAERRALLSIHDHAAGLPAEERERFVTDGFGKYYVSIYAR